MNRIIGIDLAWGERKPDGVCVLEVDGTTVSIRATFLCRGDKELMESVAQYSSCYPTLLAVDAPLVCPNLTGARPVDRLTHVHFGKFYAGSHPANLTRCLRPVRVTNHLVQLGFRLGWTFSNANDVDKLMVEVYPHPAMVRLFNLKQRIAYKRGPVAQRRIQFNSLQSHLRRLLKSHFSEIKLDRQTGELLSRPWTKDVEDQTDAFFCALIGYWHWIFRGTKSEILGDLHTGFILIPKP